MRKKCILATLSFFLIFVLTISLINRNHLTSFSSEEQKFLNYTEELFKSEMSSSGFNLRFYLENPKAYGITTKSNSIGHINYESIINSQAFYIDCIDTLEKFNVRNFSKQAKLTYDILLSHLRNQLDFSDYCLFYEPLTPGLGIQAQLPILLSQYNFDSTSDIDAYLDALASIPTYFAEILNFEKIKLENKTFMSKDSLDAVINQCHDFTQNGYTILEDSFIERLKHINLSKQEASSYIKLNTQILSEKVIPAYSSLANGLLKLSDKCPPHLGLNNLEKGRNYYSYLVRQSTGSSKTVAQIEKLIEESMKNDYKNMIEISHDLNSKEIKLINSVLIKSNEPTDFLEDLIGQISDTFPKAGSKKYQVKTVPKTLEKYLSPAFYITPPIDRQNNNTIFINKKTPISNRDMYTTLAHEGYPGHLYQTTYFYSTNPPLIRHLLNFDGYTEGWATYAEFYSYKFLYDENIASYLTSSSSYSLGAYCMADIGIHYHGWNLEKTTEYLSSLGFADKNIIKQIYDSLISEPANYLKYYVGYLEFIELKNYMKHLYKEDFSEYNFHKLVLDIGPAPFEIIKKYMINEFHSGK